MKISCSFDSLRDLSDVSKGEKLLEILDAHGLVIEKAGEQEPIKKNFISSDFLETWKGKERSGEYASCCLLFKGKQEIKFTGIAIWNVNIHPKAKAINRIHLWLTIPKKYDFKKLLYLGDDLFTWWEAVYGYIGKDSREDPDRMLGHVDDGIPGLTWVNYFGEPYLKEANFHIPIDQVPVGHGVRCMLGETPEDERLKDEIFLEDMKNQFGIQWFASRPTRRDKRIPLFDRSEITRK